MIGVRGESMESMVPIDYKILVGARPVVMSELAHFIVGTNDGLIVKRVGEDADDDWMLVSDSSSSDWPSVPWLGNAKALSVSVWITRMLIGP